MKLIYNLKIRVEELKHNQEEILPSEDEIEKALKSYKDYCTFLFILVLNKKLTALTTLRRFDKVQSVSQKVLVHTVASKITWFTLYENISILHFYQSQYGETFTTYQKVIVNKHFKLLPSDRQEIFKLYRAYLQFFINMDVLPVNKALIEYKMYKSSKFSNQVPIFSNDKKGVNISIIITHFLLFTEGKYQKATEKIESIKQYSHAHLRKDATYRSNCFFENASQIGRV